MEKIKVLIVDDSALMRNIVSHMITGNSTRLEVCGTAVNGRFALDKIKMLHPDVIVTDLEMPEMNGIEFLKECQVRKIIIPVIVLSSLAISGARITMEALSLGARDFVQKPSSDPQAMKALAQQLVFLLEKYGSSHRSSLHLSSIHPLGQPKFTDFSKKKSERLPPTPVSIVAVGISTGGPPALRQILSSLSSDFPAPILIVQHMPPGFTYEFARSLNKVCPLEVKEAQEGDVIQSGRVFVAPGGKHMIVKKRELSHVIGISDDSPQNSHKPSAGKLFTSVAQHFGSRSLAVIMTGMGHDGSEEIGSIYRLGGITIGQDEASSVVYGMSKVAEQKGFLDYILDVEEIALKMKNLVEYSLRL